MCASWAEARVKIEMDNSPGRTDPTPQICGENLLCRRRAATAVEESFRIDVLPAGDSSANGALTESPSQPPQLRNRHIEEPRRPRRTKQRIDLVEMRRAAGIAFTGQKEV